VEVWQLEKTGKWRGNALRRESEWVNEETPQTDEVKPKAKASLAKPAKDAKEITYPGFKPREPFFASLAPLRENFFAFCFNSKI
jgi:hypothetical protein